jgi:hypothetical protein
MAILVPLIIFVLGMLVGGVVVAGIRLGAAFDRRPARQGRWRVFALGSVIGLVTSIGCAGYTCFFLLQSRAATATVVKVEEAAGKDKERVFSLTYAYDVDGVRYEDRTSSSDDRQFGVGDRIPIRYRQDRPHESRIDYWPYRWGLSICLFGGAFGFAGLAAVVRMGEQGRRGRQDGMVVADKRQSVQSQ